MSDRVLSRGGSFLRTTLQAGAGRAGHALPDSRVLARQKRGSTAQRADPSRRPGDRRPRLLCPRLFHGAARRAVRRVCRCAGRSPRAREADGRRQVRQTRLLDVSRLPRASGPAGPRRRAHHHRLQLARHALDLLRPGPARTCTARSPARRRLRRAWRWPRRSAAPGASIQGGMQRRNVPHFELAVELARQRQARQASDGPCPSRRNGDRDQRLADARARAAQREVDWDLFLGHGGLAAVQPQLAEFGFRERRRAGRRRRPRMGLALHRPLPVGQQRR